MAQLDTNVVALMKAISQRESGNKAVLPQEKGIGGASIYQYTTGTWKGVAQKYLGDANSELNRANENKATYYRIKEWKDKGYSPAQIASMWNAGEGEPNAYTGKFSNGNSSVGVNSYGVKYDVPAHTRAVLTNYQNEVKKIKQTQPAESITSQIKTDSMIRKEEEPEKKNILSRAASFVAKDVFGGGVQGDTNIAGEIFRSTLGSKGAAGVGQELGKNLGSLVLNLVGKSPEEATVKLNESLAKTTDQTTELIKKLRTTTDEETKNKYIKQINDNYQMMNEGKKSYEDLVQKYNVNEDVKEATRRAFSNSINTVLTGAIGSGEAVTGATKGALGKLSVGTLSKYPTILPTAEKVLTYGKGVIPRAIEQAGIGAGFVAGENIREGEPITKNVGTGALFGAGVAGVGAVASKAASKLTPEVAKTNLVKNLDDIFNNSKQTVSKTNTFNKQKGINLAEEIANKVDDVGKDLEVANDRLKFSNNLINKSEDIITKNSEVIDDLVKQYPDTYKSIDELKKSVNKTIADNIEIKNASRVEKVQKQANKIIDGYAKQEGTNLLNLEKIQEYKKGAWNNTKKFNKANKFNSADAYSEIGSTFAKILEKEMPDTNTRAINKIIGKNIELVKFMNKVNSEGGLVLKGGKLGSLFQTAGGTLSGVIIGSMVGGVPGSVIGGMAGKQMSNILRNLSQNKNILGFLDRYLIKFLEKVPDDKAALEAKAFINAVKKGEKTPTVTPTVEKFFTDVQDYIKTKYGTGEKLALPAPTSKTPKAPINLPEKSYSSIQKSIKESGIIPKEKAYKPVILEKEQRALTTIPKGQAGNPIITPAPTVIEKQVKSSSDLRTALPTKKTAVKKTKLPTQKVSNESKLIDKGKKYKYTYNLQDKEDLDYLKQIFSEEKLNEMKQGKMTTWNGKNYQDIAGVNIINETPKTIEQKLSGKIKDVKLKSNTFYHGTSSENAENIIKNGFKIGKNLPKNNFRGGGYGKIQNSISLAETPKEASIFSSLSKNGKVLEVKLKPKSKVVSIEGVQDAIDLEDYISYLKKQGIDAVYIGGGEKELVVINLNSIILK